LSIVFIDFGTLGSLIPVRTLPSGFISTVRTRTTVFNAEAPINSARMGVFTVQIDRDF
jgi:hypothetical protein